MTLHPRSWFLAAVAAALLLTPVGAHAQSNRWLPYEGHMTVHFAIDHNGMSLTRGSFRELTGELIFDEAKPEASQLTVQTSSGRGYTRISGTHPRNFPISPNP